MPRHTFACMSDVDYIYPECWLYMILFGYFFVTAINLYTTYYLQLCHYKHLGNVVCWMTEKKLQNYEDRQSSWRVNKMVPLVACVLPI